MGRIRHAGWVPGTADWLVLGPSWLGLSPSSAGPEFDIILLSKEIQCVQLLLPPRC